MHDIDRAMFEFEQAEETGEFQEVAEETGESFESSEHNEALEEELAAELLEVASGEELEQFLGNLISSGVSAARSFISSPTGQALGGVLKNAARQALPQVGGIIGSAIGGTRGAKFGTDFGKLVGNQFEALSGEDREFEVAKAFVRTARQAARIARRPTTLPPRQAATRAVVIAARRTMPDLVPLIVRPAGAYQTVSTVAAPSTPPAPLATWTSGTEPSAPIATGATTGRWIRRGNRIIILGA